MAVSKSTDKWKLKKWINIYTPESLGNSVIGEMPANEEKDAVGRVIKVNMSWITNKMSHSFMIVGLKVNDVSGSAAHTSIKYIEQTYSYLHSLVRRGSSAIYTVDPVKDKDGKKIIMKLMLVTSSKVATPKKKALRKALSEFTKTYASSRDCDSIVKEMIEGSMQSEGINSLRKIASVSKLEVKRLEL